MNGQPHRKSWANRFGIGRRIRRKDERPLGVATLEEQRQKLSKSPSRDTMRGNHDNINELGEREYSIFNSATATLQDHTEMMHGLSMRDSMESLIGGEFDGSLLDDHDPAMVALRKRNDALLSSVPQRIWQLMAIYLSPADRAQLALASKWLLRNLGGDEMFAALNRPENQREKLKLLRHLDRHFPNHLLCFACVTYHRRIQPGHEKPPGDKFSATTIPAMVCPAAHLRIFATTQNTRLTTSRILPYAFVQLPLRSYRYGPTHGVPAERLAREWTTKSGFNSGGQPRWRHSTRYVVDSRTRHLLLRVRSHAFAPPNLPPAGMRHLLYEREEYTTYFSACAHWADGELMQVCKCALSHIPEARPRGVAEQLKRGPQAMAHNLAHTRKDWDSQARECGFCQPARRCPKCPSEYLVKVNLVEDRSSRDPHELFKFAIVVMRYVDLGDGSGPGFSPEWDAVNGVLENYDSLALLGKRAIMGTFESIATGSVPGMPRMISMNPKMRTGARDGN